MDVSIPQSPPQIVDGITLKFPAVLWRLVNSCNTGAIGWESDGTCVRIDQEKFEENYLNTQTFFKTKNFQSFIRQLNIYGFRKLPSHYHRSQDEAVFVYRHECFSRGHPERLSGVVRNTAVRRTQREKSIRDLEAKHGKILFDDNDSHDKSPVKTKICCLKKEVDESHPLLKSNQASNGLPTGTLAGTQKRAKSSKVTTVYFNSRGPTSDIQTMSPSKLHHQVADILSALNQSDDEDGPPFKRSCTIRTVHRPADLEKKGATLACLDKLSQDSNLPTSCNHLMFGCPLDENDDLDDNDLSLDFDPSLYGTNHDYMSILNSLNTDFGSKCLDDGLCHTVMCSRDIDVLNGQMMCNNAIDSVTSFLDDQILTPAYFDPETGLVTLLLPEF